MDTSQQVISICIQLQQNMLIPREDNNILEIFGLYKNDKLEKQDIEADHRNLIDESFDTKSGAKDGLSGITL